MQGIWGSSRSIAHPSSHSSRPEQLKGKAFLHCQRGSGQSQAFPPRAGGEVSAGSRLGLSSQLLSARRGPSWVSWGQALCLPGFLHVPRTCMHKALDKHCVGWRGTCPPSSLAPLQ